MNAYTTDEKGKIQMEPLGGYHFSPTVMSQFDDNKEVLNISVSDSNTYELQDKQLWQSWDPAISKINSLPPLIASEQVKEAVMMIHEKHHPTKGNLFYSHVYNNIDPFLQDMLGASLTENTLNHMFIEDEKLNSPDLFQAKLHEAYFIQQNFPDSDHGRHPGDPITLDEAKEMQDFFKDFSQERMKEYLSDYKEWYMQDLKDEFLGTSPNDEPIRKLDLSSSWDREFIASGEMNLHELSLSLGLSAYNELGKRGHAKVFEEIDKALSSFEDLRISLRQNMGNISNDEALNEIREADKKYQADEKSNKMQFIAETLVFGNEAAIKGLTKVVEAYLKENGINKPEMLKPNMVKPDPIDLSYEGFSL